MQSVADSICDGSKSFSFKILKRKLGSNEKAKTDESERKILDIPST